MPAGRIVSVQPALLATVFLARVAAWTVADHVLHRLHYLVIGAWRRRERAPYLVYTMPFWVILLAPLTLKERIRDAQRFAVVLALVGLLLILSPWRHAPDLVSSLLALTAGLFWALSVLVAKTIPVSDSWDLLSVTGWQMLFGAVPLMVIAGIFPGHAVDWTPAYIGALLYNIVPANALAWVLWLFVVGRLSATLSGLSSLATPVMGVFVRLVATGGTPATGGSRWHAAGVAGSCYPELASPALLK